MMRWAGVGLIALASGCTNDLGPGVTGDAAGSGSGPDATIPGGVGEPPELMGMTLYHNQIRAAVETPDPLPPLQWDPDLAAYAAAWAAQCIDNEAPTGLIDHNGARQGVAGYQYIGENIYGSSGPATAQDATTSWGSEKSRYNYATNSCAGICGHYTQIVWRATTHVGCALQNCAGLQFGGTIVCDYGPGGNDGTRPY